MNDQIIEGLEYLDGSNWRSVKRESDPAMSLARLRTLPTFLHFLRRGYTVEWMAVDYRLQGDRQYAQN